MIWLGRGRGKQLTWHYWRVEQCSWVGDNDISVVLTIVPALQGNEFSAARNKSILEICLGRQERLGGKRADMFDIEEA